MPNEPNDITNPNDYEPAFEFDAIDTFAEMDEIELSAEEQAEINERFEYLKECEREERKVKREIGSQYHQAFIKAYNRDMTGNTNEMETLADMKREELLERLAEARYTRSKRCEMRRKNKRFRP